MKLRVGLVSLGSAWESRQRSALRALSDRFEVRAICDPVAARAEQAAREFGAVAVDGFRALARRDDVDAVMVLSLDWYGSLPILAACDAGKAVYSAAGLETDPQRANRIREKVEQSGVAFMAECPCRHSPATLRLKELMATQLGQSRLLFCHRREPAVPLNGSLSSTRPVSSTLDELIHLVDWCRYVVGHEPTSVMGLVHRPGGYGAEEDYQVISLDFSPPEAPGTGTVAQISCGRYVPASWSEAVAFRTPAAMQAVCERGIAFIDLPSKLVWFDDAGRHLESLDHERPVGEYLLNQFHRSVTSLIRDTASLEDSYRSLSLVLKARESHAQGRRLSVDQ